jgi:thioredoxin reductase (NADPH)
MKDLLIIGAGPAGLSAAIYGKRAGLYLLVIEKFAPGGQVMNTWEVENYPGFVEPVKGWELVSAMEGQAKRLGTEIINGDAKSITKNEASGVFSIELTDGNVYESRSIILACGASYSKLDVPGETELTGKGVSYCATCDGAFFKNKLTAVVGGGNTALEEAEFLTRFVDKVYLIHRRDKFRGAKILQDRVFANKKIEILYNSKITEIHGDNIVASATVLNVNTNTRQDLKLDGVFIFVGNTANTGFLPESILNEKGEVITDKNLQTPIRGLFAAGDMRAGSKKQILMAAADGATALLNVNDYLLEEKHTTDTH